MFRRTLSLIAFATSLCLFHEAPAVAYMGRRDLQLEVYVNGSDTNEIVSFAEIDGSLYAASTDLRTLGFAMSDPKPVGTLIALSSITGVQVQIDERKQFVRLTVPFKALATHQIGSPQLGPSTASNNVFGGVFNYDLTTTVGHKFSEIYGFGSARLFSPVGVLQTDFTAARTGSRVGVIRLATTYSYSDSSSLRTYSAGDVISGSLPSTRSVRLGGVQLSTNFALRPDLITYPLPEVSGGTAVPSTVDVLVNGIRQFSQSVSPGPFFVPRLPVIGGAGQVSITVRDASGRQTTQTSNFYTTSALLVPGLPSFSLEVGSLRQRFGTESEAYGVAALSATGRLGVTAGFTAEGHFEATAHLLSATGGGTFKIADFAVVSGAASLSRSDSDTGEQALVSVDRSTTWYHIGASVLVASSRYRDIAALYDDPTPRHAVQANIGLIFGKQGSVV